MNYMHDFGSGIGFGIPLGFSFFLLVALWTIFWKGLALWHSAHRDERWWFVALLLINTVGILEIVYLFFFAKLTFAGLFPKSAKASGAAPTGESKE